MSTTEPKSQPDPTRLLIPALVTIGSMVALIIVAIALFGEEAENDSKLRDAAELYATGLSLAEVANRYEIDPETVANRFRRAGVPVRPRRGRTSRVRSEHDQR